MLKRVWLSPEVEEFKSTELGDWTVRRREKVGSLGLWLLSLRVERRAWPASKGTMLGLGQLSWRWLGDLSLS